MNRFFHVLAIALLCLVTTQAATIRIVAYGDSCVAGKGVPRDQVYPAQLEQMLRQKSYDVSVTNAGVNGRTSSDAIANLDASIPTSTNIAIVQFGVNDVKHGISASQVRSNMEQVVSRLRARGIGVLVFFGNPH